RRSSDLGNFLDGDRYDEILGKMQAASQEEASPVAETADASSVEEEVHANVALIQVPFHEDKPSASVMAASNLRNELKKAGADLGAEAVPFGQLQNNPQTLIIIEEDTDKT